MHSDTALPAPQGISLFFVEDDENDYRLALRQFSRQNTEVSPQWHTNCREAMAMFEKDTFDAIVTDLNIPEGSGVDLVRFVRSLDGNIPIIVLTGNGSESDAVEAIRHGANDYLVKGTDSFAQLPAQIAGLVNAYRLEKARQQTTAELQLLRDRFQDFAEAASDWFWEKGPDLKFTFISGTVQDNLGLPPSHFLGRSVWEVLADAPTRDKWQHEKEVRERRSFRDFVCRIAVPMGGVRTVRLSGKAVFTPDGAFAGYRGIGSDITKQIENADRLQEALEAAVEANQAKSRFLAVMSHEFRTPLNAIIGFTDAMLGGVAGPVHGKQAEYLEDVRTAGLHMLSLVRDILDLSRIEAGQYDLDIETLNVRDEVSGVLKMIDTVAADGGTTLEPDDIDGGLTIDADPRALAQVMSNILSNAIKFTPPGGHIFISARETELAVEICIRDTGIGIPTDKLGEIARPFYQISNVLARKHDGSGLGLSIASGLVEAHGGTITITSEVRVGTEVCMTFPHIGHGTA